MAVAPRGRNRGDRRVRDELVDIIFRRHGGGSEFGRPLGELVAELGYETLRRPRAGFAEGADGFSRDIVGDAFQCVGILFDPTTGNDAVGNFLHPLSTLTAGGALATRFVGIELVDVVQDFHHVPRIIHDDDAAGPRHGSGCGERIEIHREVFEFNLGVLYFVDFASLEDFCGASARDDRFQLATGLQPSAEIVDEFAESQTTDCNLKVAWFLDVPTDAKDAGAGVVWFTDFGVFLAPHSDDVLHVAEGLHVVHNSRALVQTEDGREIGGLDSWVGALALERLDEAGFFAADVGACAAMDVDFAVESAAEDVFAEEAFRAGLCKGFF